MNMRATLLSVLLLLCPIAAQAAPDIGKPAPEFFASAADGNKVDLASYHGKIVVLEWNNPECPFVRKHYGSNNMQKLQAYAHSKGVSWITVNSAGAGKE